MSSIIIDITREDSSSVDAELLLGLRGQTGLSAYEYAVMQGYSGTENDFSILMASYATVAEAAAESASESAQSAVESAQSATNSAESASESSAFATASAQSASDSQGYAQDAYNSSVTAENAKDDAIDARDEIRSMRANAETLEPNQSATASYSNGVLTLGIPKGQKGDTGDTGETGDTPNISIGNVETLEPSEDAYVTRRGTDANPIFDFGIPKGDDGTVPDLDLILPTDTASGDIVSIPDGQSVVPVKSLKVTLEPIQSGSGTPSPDNVRPISGHTEVVTEVCGVNVWDEEWRSGYYTPNGDFSANDACVANVNHVRVAPNQTYYFSLASRYSSGVRLVFRDASENLISVTTLSVKGTFATPSNCEWLDFGTFGASGVSSYQNDISINYPSTDTDYHA